MLKKATLDTFDKIVKENQELGSQSATIIGIMLTIMIVGDAYLNAIGKPSVTFFFISLFDHSDLRGGLSWMVLAIQSILLLIALSSIRLSPWPTLLPKELLSIFRKDKIRDPNKNRPNFINIFLINWKLMVFAVIILCCFAAANYLSRVLSLENFADPTIIMLFQIVLAIAAAWILTAILISCKHDRATLIGLVMGLVILVVGSAYARQGLLSLNDTKQLLYVSDFNFWQLGLILAILFLCLSSLVQGQEDKTIICLGLGQNMSLPYWQYSASGIKFTKPLYVRLETQGNKIIAMTRHENSKEYILINTNDEHHKTPLERHSIKIWNISFFEKNVTGPFKRNDRSGYFSLTGKIGHITTTAPYFDKKEGDNYFDPISVELATDIIFKDDLSELIQRAIENAFEKSLNDQDLGDLREKIDEILTTVSDAPVDMTMQEGKLEQFNNEISSLIFSDESRKQKKIIALNKLREIRSAEKTFKEIRLKLGFISERLPDLVIKEILHEFDKVIKETGINKSRKEEAEKIIRLLGLRLSGFEVKLIGEAIACGQALNDIRQELEKRMKDAEDKYEQHIDKLEDKKDEYFKLLLQRPDIRPETFAEVARSMSVSSNKVDGLITADSKKNVYETHTDKDDSET